MSSSPLRTSPWRLSSAPPSSSSADGVSAGIAPTLSDDWLSWFDFSDLPSVTLTPADLPQILDVDCFDISDLLPPEANPRPCDLSEENPPFFNLSDGFSSISEPHKPVTAHTCEGIVAVGAGTPSLHNNSSTVSSSHNSDAGSSIAAADSFVKEGVCGQAMKNSTTYVLASSHKRGHEDIGSDMEGGASAQDPVDKKHQRLVRNRELAFESRQRKKCYIGHLEAKCKMLEQERNQLQQQVCFSVTENAVLKEELARMKKLKGRDGVTEPAVLFKDSLPLEFLSLLICLLLMARVSLCVSPFLALVLRAAMCFQSPIKAKGLLKEQVGSERRVHYIVYKIPWPFNHLQFHRPRRVGKVSMAGA